MSAAVRARTSRGAFSIILSDPQVKGILVNIFGGIMDCNTIATGIVAPRVKHLKLPLVVDRGKMSSRANRPLAQSGLTMIGADDLAMRRGKWWRR